MRGFIIVVSFLFATIHCRAQGCSDAGFCTAGALQGAHHDVKDTILKNSIALSVSVAEGERNTSIIIPQIEYTRGVGHKGMLAVKLPYYRASGALGSNSGVSDPVISYSHQLLQKKDWMLQGTIGTRISTGSADKKDDAGVALPMPYQANLGTTDVILGASIQWKKYVTAAIGYQQPLAQYNKNGYNPSAVPVKYQGYFLSKELKRSGDILLRLEGQYAWNKFGVAAGPLFIYHLANDKGNFPTLTNMEIEGSSGLTLNATAKLFYNTGRWMIDIGAGKPMVVRKVRPDGLTREWLVTPKVSYSF